MTDIVKAVTANRLLDGEPVFWSGAGWAEQFAQAALYAAPAAADAALSQARARAAEIVDPYMIDVASGEAGPAPVSFRERVRALGPTIHPDLGKQAVGGSGVEALRRAGGVGRSSGRLSLIRRK